MPLLFIGRMWTVNSSTVTRQQFSKFTGYCHNSPTPQVEGQVRVISHWGH